MTKFNFYVDYQADTLFRSYFSVEAQFLGDALDLADSLMNEPGLDHYNNEEFNSPIFFGSPVFLSCN
jgi:hypothetical protein